MKKSLTNGNIKVMRCKKKMTVKIKSLLQSFKRTLCLWLNHFENEVIKDGSIPFTKGIQVKVNITVSAEIWTRFANPTSCVNSHYTIWSSTEEEEEEVDSLQRTYLNLVRNKLTEGKKVHLIIQVRLLNWIPEVIW